MSKLYYLASPYSHPEEWMMNARFEVEARVAARLLSLGIMVHSPISHSHPMAVNGELPTDWDFWKEYDTLMISRCDGLIVLTIDGWIESKGVQAEIEIARELGLPVIIWPEEIWK